MTYAAGRTLDEQLDCIRKYGSHAITPVVKARLLNGLGIAGPKPNAENVIIFGCYPPFTVPLLVRDYLKLLDILGLEYTYLDWEYCCGQPLMTSSVAEELEKSKGCCKEFVKMNRDSARQKGAKNIAYYCIGCAHAAKGSLPEEAAHHMYYFELLLDKLEGRKLRITPTTVGYYEGCKVRYKRRFPEVSHDWGRLRRQLDSIEGLKMVDLPNHICCWESQERIVEAAEKQNLDTILCSCNSCYNRIRAAAAGRLRVMYLTELLLQAVV